MTIVGIEERVWTVIGVVDTYFEEKDSQSSMEYHHDRRKTSLHGQRQDPMSRRIELPVAGDSFSDPRKYYLTVLEIWMTKIFEEYDGLTNEMEEVVKKKRVEPFLPSVTHRLQSHSQ